jgi:hypothetical protein
LRVDDLKWKREDHFSKANIFQSVSFSQIKNNPGAKNTGPEVKNAGYEMLIIWLLSNFGPQ